MKITLLGDSIRIQYQSKVTELLGSDFEVFAPTENCRFAKYTLRGLFDWGKEMSGSRIVHWNNGLWDICNIFGDGVFTSEKEYVENMLRIADILVKKHEKVIFATTTPVTERNPYNQNSDIIHYNEILVPRLIERGVIINDLHMPLYADIERYICDDNVHLTEEGISLCANMTANIISDTAATMSHNAEIKEGETQDIKKGAHLII